MISNYDGEIVLKFVKVLPEAYTPTKTSEMSAGYDLKSAFNYIVPARGKAKINTAIKIELPLGTYGRIAPRSGLAEIKSIDVGAGVIDYDYRGIIHVILFNHSDEAFEIKRGDRIAQLICQKIIYPKLIEVIDLTNTERGENGFGSSDYQECNSK